MPLPPRPHTQGMLCLCNFIAREFTKMIIKEHNYKKLPRHGYHGLRLVRDCLRSLVG